MSRTLYDNRPMPHPQGPTIALIGPSIQEYGANHWLAEALQYFKNTAFTGRLLSPSWQNEESTIAVNDSLGWLQFYEERADLILYWIPACPEESWNWQVYIEAGLMIRSPKLIFGTDQQTPITEYIQSLLQHHHRPCYNDLQTMIVEASMQVMKKDSSDPIRILRYSDVPAAVKLYCAEENEEVTAALIQEAEKAFVFGDQKGDLILGYFDNDSKLIGALSLHFMYDLYPGYTKGPYVHFETIIVDRDWQGKGIGTALVREAIELARQRNATYGLAQTGSDNLAAQRIYIKNGMIAESVNFYYHFSSSNLPEMIPSVNA